MAREMIPISARLVSGKNRGKSYHHKTRTGCVTCKQRRIKCDERKPYCLRCELAGKVCGGYKPPKAQIFQLREAKRFDTPTEARLFQYFMERTTPCLSGYAKSVTRFFDTLCLQSSHTDAAIKHSLVAIAAIQEASEANFLASTDPPKLESQRTFSIIQYNKAIKLLTEPAPSKPSIEVVLICCLLFYIYEMFCFDNANHNKHLFAGLEIIRDHTASKEGKISTPASSTLQFTLIPVLTRFGISAAAYTDHGIEQESWYAQEWAIENGLHIPKVFEDIFQAYERLDALMGGIFRATFEPTPAKTATSSKLRTSHIEFLAAVERTSEPTDPRFGKEWQAGVKILRIHHRAATIMLETLSLSNELAYDKFLESFHFIVSESGEILRQQNKVNRSAGETLPVPVSLIPPLFLVATRCRSVSLRYKAIETLHMYPMRERLWTSCTAVQTAIKLAQIEQQLEPNRIKLINVQI